MSRERSRPTSEEPRHGSGSDDREGSVRRRAPLERFDRARRQQVAGGFTKLPVLPQGSLLEALAECLEKVRLVLRRIQRSQQVRYRRSVVVTDLQTQSSTWRSS